MTDTTKNSDGARSFLVNEGKLTSTVTHCRAKVNKSSISREVINGDEHIVISSSTLPDDVVMNGVMYPADEVKASLHTLDLTLAPIEHPVVDGIYVSANDPRAINTFHVGAFNVNARHDGGRVLVDKYINVNEARKSEKGKRLLDRIDEIENSKSPRPIHTSIAVFSVDEVLDKPRSNADGLEYSMIARNMIFDHDAILLDSVGAAQPSDGVGIGVNSKGDKVKVNSFALNSSSADKSSFEDYIGALSLNDDQILYVKSAISKITANESSVSDLHRAVYEALEKAAIGVSWIEELYNDRVIFSYGENMYEVPYVMDSDGIVTIMGVPMPVERRITYEPLVNDEGVAVKKKIIAYLKKMNVNSVDEMSDDQLLEKYDELRVSESSVGDGDGDGDGDAPAGNGDGDAPAGNGDISVNSDIAKVLQAMSNKLDGLESKISSSENVQRDQYAEIVVNSESYPDLTLEDAKKLGSDTLKKMAANCMPSYGISPVVHHSAGSAAATVPDTMPE